MDNLPTAPSKHANQTHLLPTPSSPNSQLLLQTHLDSLFVQWMCSSDSLLNAIVPPATSPSPSETQHDVSEDKMHQVHALIKTAKAQLLSAAESLDTQFSELQRRVEMCSGAAFIRKIASKSDELGVGDEQPVAELDELRSKQVVAPVDLVSSDSLVTGENCPKSAAGLGEIGSADFLAHGILPVHVQQSVATYSLDCDESTGAECPSETRFESQAQSEALTSRKDSGIDLEPDAKLAALHFQELSPSVNAKAGLSSPPLSARYQFYYPFGNPNCPKRIQRSEKWKNLHRLNRNNTDENEDHSSIGADNKEQSKTDRSEEDFKFVPERREVHIELEAVRKAFVDNEIGGTGKLTKSDMWPVMDALGLPRYLSFAFFDKLASFKAGFTNSSEENPAEAQQFLEYNDIERYWLDLNKVFHDEHAVAFEIMRKGNNHRRYLVPDDFHSVVDEVVKRHPGLEFLSSLAVFQARYVDTVITRTFFNKMHSYSGKMTLPEFRKHTFLDLLVRLQLDDDINFARDVFSYKHFYVIYCKFWELDSDHNMVIEARDLYEYDRQSITSAVMDRVVSGAGKPLEIKRGALESVLDAEKETKISYRDFVWFVLCVEDKRNDASIDYWFRCLDLDGDGKLSLHELSIFYEQQAERMSEYRMSEPWKFDDFVCSLFDLIKPANPSYFTPRDLKNARQVAGLFFDMIFDLRKYDAHVRRIDPFFRELDDVYVEDETGQRMKLEGWDKFAERAYEQLAYEESGGASGGGGCSDDINELGELYENLGLYSSDEESSSDEDDEARSKEESTAAGHWSMGSPLDGLDEGRGKAGMDALVAAAAGLKDRRAGGLTDRRQLSEVYFGQQTKSGDSGDDEDEVLEEVDISAWKKTRGAVVQFAENDDLDTVD